MATFSSSSSTISAVLRQITAEYPTPFHLYDEKGIRQKARDLHKAFAWNKGFKEPESCAFQIL